MTTLFLKEPNIYTINIDGSNFHQLIKLDDFRIDEEPAWSPDGHFIAFSSDYRSSESGIYLVNVQTSEIHLLYSYRDASRPIWSPDGQFIAFSTGSYPSREFHIGGIHNIFDFNLVYSVNNIDNITWSKLLTPLIVYLFSC